MNQTPVCTLTVVIMGANPVYTEIAIRAANAYIRNEHYEFVHGNRSGEIAVKSAYPVSKEKIKHFSSWIGGYITGLVDGETHKNWMAE